MARGAAMERELAGMWIRAVRRLDTARRGSKQLPSLTQLQLLEVLDEGALPLMAVARRLGITGATCTRAVDSAVRRGWLARIRDPQDRRVTWLRATPEGLRARHDLEDLIETQLIQSLTTVSSEDQAAFWRTLSVLADGAPGD
jgi:DNA-binding MarR family transcriptional regulator